MELSSSLQWKSRAAYRSSHDHSGASASSSSPLPSSSIPSSVPNEITDINELSYLLNETQNEKLKLENENLEVESSLNIEMNRFQNEKESYEEMLQQKMSLKDQGSKISDSIELTLAKLEQILTSLDRNDQMAVYVDCIDAFLEQKSKLFQRVNGLRDQVDLLSSSVASLEEIYSSEIISQANEAITEYRTKKESLAILQQEISTFEPELRRLSDQTIACHQAREDLENEANTLETDLFNKKREVLKLNQELEELREKHDHSLSEQSSVENDLRMELDLKKTEIEDLLSEISASLSRLAKTNELLNVVVQNRSEAIQQIHELRLEIEKLKSEQFDHEDQIRRTEGDIRSTEAMTAVTESAIAAQRRITESYQEQSRYIVESRRPMEEEIVQMSSSIEETKLLIHKLEEQVYSPSFSFMTFPSRKSICLPQSLLRLCLEFQP
jgi:chromosome segregation ATPase